MPEVLTDLLIRAGYFLAALLLAAFPAALLFWLLVHLFARFWRRRGPAVAYSVIVILCLALAVWVFQYHRQLLAVRWPFRWLFVAVGLALYVAASWIEILCRRHLKLRTLVGAPELGKDPGEVLTEGIYGRMRHPRYLSVMLGTLAWAFILNYAAMWLLALAVIPGFYLVIFFEERELRARFGSAYEAYMKAVPNRLIPPSRG